MVVFSTCPTRLLAAGSRFQLPPDVSYSLRMTTSARMVLPFVEPSMSTIAATAMSAVTLTCICEFELPAIGVLLAVTWKSTGQLARAPQATAGTLPAKTGPLQATVTPSL